LSLDLLVTLGQRLLLCEARLFFLTHVEVRVRWSLTFLHLGASLALVTILGAEFVKHFWIYHLVENLFI